MLYPVPIYAAIVAIEADNEDFAANIVVIASGEAVAVVAVVVVVVVAVVVDIEFRPLQVLK